jgi:hypothetical protein
MQTTSASSTAGGEDGDDELAVGCDVSAVDVGIVVEFSIDPAERAHRARRFEGAGVDLDTSSWLIASGW